MTPVRAEDQVQICKSQYVSYSSVQHANVSMDVLTLANVSLKKPSAQCTRCYYGDYIQADGEINCGDVLSN